MQTEGFPLLERLPLDERDGVVRNDGLAGLEQRPVGPDHGLVVQSLHTRQITEIRPLHQNATRRSFKTTKRGGRHSQTTQQNQMHKPLIALWLKQVMRCSLQKVEIKD